LFAQISELDVDLAADMIVNGEGNADAARFCDALKPRRDIDAISKDVMGLDDYVADVDTYTESNTPVLRLSRCKFLDAGLELHSSPNRLDRAPKFCQEPVASVFYDPATMLRDRGLYSVRQEHAQTRVRCLLVIVH
jgi:hypothetical protein